MTATTSTRSLYDNGRDNEVITVNGVRGILVNKREIDSWARERERDQNAIPLSAYPPNVDPNPNVTKRRIDEPVRSRQDVIVRFLKPPPPPPHGEIVIQQAKPRIPDPAPPIVIRQYQPSSNRPSEPIVIREVPPKLAPPQPRKIVNILPPIIDPPPRKVVIEKYPPVDEPVAPVIVERWLAPKPPTRRIIFDGVVNVDQFKAAPIHNEIIEYEPPQVLLNQEIKDVEVVDADPNQYYSMYRDKLVDPNQLPEYAKKVRPPAGFQLASEAGNIQPVLEGDIDALARVDLEREGLTEYKIYVQKGNTTTTSNSYNTTTPTAGGGGNTIGQLVASSSGGSNGSSYYSGGNNGANNNYSSNRPYSSTTPGGEAGRVITISSGGPTSPTQRPGSGYEVRASSTMTTDGSGPGAAYERRTTIYRSDGFSY